MKLRIYLVREVEAFCANHNITLPPRKLSEFVAFIWAVLLKFKIRFGLAQDPSKKEYTLKEEELKYGKLYALNMFKDLQEAERKERACLLPASTGYDKLRFEYLLLKDNYRKSKQQMSMEAPNSERWGILEREVINFQKLMSEKLYEIQKHLDLEEANYLINEALENNENK